MIVHDSPAPSPSSLAFGQESGLVLPASVGAELARLHACRRGQISLLVLLLGLVFYALVALVWNTGEVTSAKIEAQTAADAAAYSSAVWTSRAINVTAGTNMLILRHITAAEAAMAGFAVAIGPWFDWSKAVSTACAATGPGYPVCVAVAWLGIIALEVLPRWVPFMLAWTDGFLRVTTTGGKYGQNVYGRITELYRYQQAFIDAVPYAIEQQRLALEDYYDCEIALVRGDGTGLNADGTSAISAPLRRGNPLTISAPLLIRSYWELLGNKPDPKGKGGSWHHSKELKFMFVGKGQSWWTRGVLVSMAAHWPALGWFHNVLTTQVGPAEFSPHNPLVGGWEEFSVVAVARKRPDNSTSMQPPRRPLGFMAPGIFAAGVNPVAYAQAESFNGMDGHPWLRAILIHPWRVWTTYGWQWQPRLAHGAFFPAYGDALLDLPVGPAVNVSSTQDLSQVSLH